MSFATIMVHIDVVRDSEQRIQLALGLADRFGATLIGVAGLALRPAFATGGRSWRTRRRSRGPVGNRAARFSARGER